MVHFFHHHVEVVPVILYLALSRIQGLFDGGGERAAQGKFILLEQLGDNLVLALEVVIEIAGADVHFVGNIDGSGMCFTLHIE